MSEANVDRSGYAPRAMKGGAVGANGEFYKGGQFIANSEHTTKGGSMRWEPAPVRERAAWELEAEARKANVEAWLAARVAEFAAVLKVLEAEPVGVFETFYQSLARSLRYSGSLSRRQAKYAANAVIGRRKKANADAWDALEARLQEQYSDEGSR